MCSKCHQAFIKTTCSAKVNNSFLYSSNWFSLSFFTFNLSIQSLWQEKLQSNSKFSAQLGTGVVWAERGTPLKSCSPLFLHCAVSNLTLFFFSQTQYVYYIGLWLDISCWLIYDLEKALLFCFSCVCSLGNWPLQNSF